MSLERVVPQAGPSTDPLDPRGGSFLLSGNEALARAALTAHVGFAASYPGSPITEANEWLLTASGRRGWPAAQWSTNEHVALHAGTGASWAGVRTLVTMKQVGLHVASDPMAYLAYAGVKGGLVLGVGTDPGANSSTGEFDVRWLVRETHWPLIEPATVQEVYDFAVAAWELSESSGLPVLFHMPASLCHQVAVVNVAPLPAEAPPPGRFVPDVESFVNVGGRAVANHARLLQRLRALDVSDWHRTYKPAGHARRGVVAAGVHHPLVREVLQELGAIDVPVLKLGLSYPLNAGVLAAFAAGLDEVLVLEELDGFLSSGLQALANQARVPVWVVSSNGPDGLAAGPLTYAAARAAVAKFLGLEVPAASLATPPDLPPRPGTFCPGCSHRSPLLAIREALSESGGVYGGDIGCSSLPPHASDWLTCMGSGIGIAQGVAAVAPGQKVVASIGDSTLFHAGLPGVLNAQQQGTRLVLVVLDNQYVAMTGHQPTANTDSRRGGPPGGGHTVTIEDALRGVGVQDVLRVDAYDLKTLRFELAQALGRPGLSVLVVAGECRLQLGRREPEKIAEQPRYAIIPELCNRCGGCYEDLGCVAIHDKGTHLEIDPDACTRCGLCYQVCTDRAIAPYRLTSEQP